jgi:hypothetical protein
MDNGQFYPHSLSIINYQLSIINYQLSIINYQFSITHRLLDDSAIAGLMGLYRS